ncbi:MAG: RluA family pseudouridine synthase [Candidatus Methylacidiphilales bacterium]|nr:RluA family pseudouridine synthase [Candidatus Methylacidiphilales bacterium]
MTNEGAAAGEAGMMEADANSGPKCHVVLPGEVRERADKVLARAWGESRSRIKAWLDGGWVEGDGRVLEGKEKLPAGTRVIARPPLPEPSGVVPENIPLDILHEDTDLVVINKPSGLVVHPGAGQCTGTLVSALLHHCAGELSGIGGVERPGIVHRLDRETSGVLVVAKNDRAHRGLAGQFKDRLTRKTYQAFLLGTPTRPAGIWQEPIGRHSQQRQKMTVRTDGRASRTDYRVEQSWSRCCRVMLDLHTGRTHQIRVHASHAGHAVVGDRIYGRQPAWVAEAGVVRHLLHAWRLEFQHPRSHKTLSITAPLPEDFLAFEKTLS